MCRKSWGHASSSVVCSGQFSVLCCCLCTADIRLHFHWKLYWLCVKDSPGLAVIYSVAELLQLAATLGWRVGHLISSNATVWWHSLECDNAHPKPRVLGVVIIFICRMQWPGPDCAFFSTHWWCDVDIQSLWCWRMLHGCQLHRFFKSGVYSENIMPRHLTTGLFFSLHFNLKKINKSGISWWNSLLCAVLFVIYIYEILYSFIYVERKLTWNQRWSGKKKGDILIIIMDTSSA